MNYGHWKQRCAAESTQELADARLLIHQAKQRREEADLVGALDLYNQGLAKWRVVIDQFPGLASNSLIKDDLWEQDIRPYMELLNQIDEELPDPFILEDVLRINMPSRGKTAPPDVPLNLEPQAAPPGDPPAGDAPAGQAIP
jgi:hypothetical protein